MADDGEGGNTRQAACHEHLGSVREYALDEAGEGIQDGGCLSGIQAETL